MGADLAPAVPQALRTCGQLPSSPLSPLGGLAHAGVLAADPCVGSARSPVFESKNLEQNTKNLYVACITETDDPIPWLISK
jgi:hypothetical protein